MALKQVFYALREVFPQVDLRILKAVASQYSSDVDAAVEFVLSDVLPAVTEPTEAHYTLQDIGCAKNDHTDSWSIGTFCGRNLSPGYVGPLCTNNKLEECSHIEDKVVINETKITPTVDYAQVEASSKSSTKPPIIDYEQSALTAFVNHCAMDKGKMTPKAEKVTNQKHFNGNYNPPDFLVSSGSMLPLYMQSFSNCAVKYKGHMPLELHKDESTQDFSELEDKYNIGNLFTNICPTVDRHASVDLLGASHVHTLSESEDNYDLQISFQKEMPLKFSEAESIYRFSKSEDNYNLDTLFAEFRSNKDRQTSDSLPSVPTVQILSESEDSYDLQVLFEKEMPLTFSTAQSTHLSKSQDNSGVQVMFENIDNDGKVLDMLRTAESTPELHKSEDDLHKKACTTDSTAQVSRFLVQDENHQSPYKLDDQCTLYDLFASSKIVDNSLRIFEEKDNSYTVDSEEKQSMDFTSSRTFTNVCNPNDDFNLSELFSSTPNASLSDLDSKCVMRDEAEREIMCSNSVDKHSIVPVIEHDTFPCNGMKLMPGADKYEELLDITTRSYQIARINKLVADITNGKEALSSLYESTTIKMKEVELQEENSRKAKQDAIEAHQGFVAMVENFNQLIENSKESNDKIKFELDARLATSIEEETAAREQISQEEKLALLVRKEKEAEMGSIMEESMKLQKEAEENILLKGLLSDRGRIIDILKGEISSIHEKVIALKEGTHRSKLQPALVTTSSSTTLPPITDCKTASPGRHWPLKNRSNNSILPREKMAGIHAKDHEKFSDDEWEMLETTQA
ncbi:uncharacterized protein LOC133901929 isoform X3 [Phragmites australis]|uniref:uncharacterized protein LOC133901929 isoform X3 n=1 Tax=Phragmites australis TaxID=29695 RepID=UPI002D78BA66|nr:uncharacterized protein LOC133901929 isoform X3 [Phragmites australis]